MKTLSRKIHEDFEEIEAYKTERDPYAAITEGEIKDLLTAEARHEALVERAIVRGSGGVRIDPSSCDGRFLLFASSLFSLQGRLANSSEPVVKRVPTTWAKRPGSRLTRLGREIWGVCARYADAIRDGREWLERYGGLRLHPSVAVAFDAVRAEWELVTELINPDQAVVDGSYEQSAVEAIERFGLTIRRESAGMPFRNRLSAHEAKANDNFRSAARLLGALFRRHSKMLILRVDLYLRSGVRAWESTPEVHKALEGYLRSLRDGGVVPGYLGFILKRENGVARGVHFHLLVMLDGHEHLSAYYFTELLGKAWAQRVGPENASYYNCYGGSNSYKFNGLGAVHASDVRKLLGLRLAIWYMSKQDCLLHVEGEGVRHFRRSPIPRSSVKRGAPRQCHGAAEVIKSMLGGPRSRIPRVLVNRKR